MKKEREKKENKKVRIMIFITLTLVIVSGVIMFLLGNKAKEANNKVENVLNSQSSSKVSQKQKRY